jgi:hypothetical protein
MSGDKQSGEAAKQLINPLVIKVANEQNLPVSNINLMWSTVSGSVSGSIITDSKGLGSALWILGNTPGTQTLTVKATDVNGNEINGSPIVFSATANGKIIITTNIVTSITTNSAASGGNITGDGGSPIKARGVCWSTSTNPTISNSRTQDGAGSGSFISAISGLSPNTTYYLKAFAINNTDTGYGNQVSFLTASNLQYN